jgi:hypothetical protein
MNVVNISVYDLSTNIANGITHLGVYRSDASDGVFTEITASGTRIVLLSSTEYYTYADVSGDTYHWYKIDTFISSSSAGFTTYNPFKGNTSDITEDLRYTINDFASTIAGYRYTIKELRRYIKMAINRLQSTKYRNRFKVDSDGIISPSPSDMDKSMILMQAQLEVANSQLMNAADTNISFKDGRGTFNNRTSDALVDHIKMLTKERNELIDSYNRILGNKAAKITITGT